MRSATGPASSGPRGPAPAGRGRVYLSLGMPGGLRRLLPAAPPPDPLPPPSSPSRPARPGPAHPGRPPPAAPPSPPSSLRRPDLLTGLCPPHSGRSPSSYSATLPSRSRVAVRASGSRLHRNLYERFGGRKPQGLPIARHRLAAGLQSTLGGSVSPAAKSPYCAAEVPELCSGSSFAGRVKLGQPFPKRAKRPPSALKKQEERNCRPAFKACGRGCRVVPV